MGQRFYDDGGRSAVNATTMNIFCAMKTLRRGWFAVLLGLGVCGVASAHDPGISMAQGQFRATGLEILVGFAPLDAEQLLPPEARVSGKWTQAEFVAAQPLLAGLAPQILELRTSGGAIAPSETRVELAAGDALNFFLFFPLTQPGVVTLRSCQLGALPAGHRQFVIIADEHGSTLAKKLLSAKDDGLDISLRPAGGAGGAGEAGGGVTVAAEPVETPTFWGFLQLGVEHIWTGYDH